MIALTTDDRLEIAELSSIYAWAIDQRESDLFKRVFTDDAVITYPGGVVLRGLDNYVRYVHTFHSMHDSTQHFIANHWPTALSDHVASRSYVILTINMRNHPGGDICRGGAFYTDRVIRTEAGWRIAERNAHGMWVSGNQGILQASSDAVKDLA